MRFRSFKKIDTGQWVNVLFTVDGDQFSVPEQTHRTAIATAIGVLPRELETVDANSDLRTGVLLTLPPPPSPPLSRVQELLQINRSDWTTAQLRELLQLAAQEIT